MSTTTLSLVIALLSIITAALPVITNALLPREAQTSAGFVGANEDGTLDFSLINKGAETAVLRDATFFVRNSRLFRQTGEISYPIVFAKAENSNDFRNVKLNEIHTVSGRINFERPYNVERIRSNLLDLNSRCFLVVRFIALSGDHEIEMETECSRVLPVLAKDINKLSD
ncbi:hypothetical protein [Novosphingobium sp. YAF33]|uniref:hypothetical protein n=1 Tax=Novosphingobium sp. YAF33 TaxID=3233082 RepID=UPI003F9A24A6